MTRFRRATISNQWLGVLMLGAGALMIAAMLHHPDGVDGIEATNGMMRWVHGTLMFLIILNSYAVWRFVDQVKSKTSELVLGSIFYWIGIVAFLGGALVSGFVQSGVSDLYAQEVLNRDVFEALNRFSAILNQSLISFGLLSFGAAGIVWTIPLMSSVANTTLVGGTGFVVGACLVAFTLSAFNLSVLAMTGLAGLIVLWHGSIAVWFFQNEKPKELSDA